jgi:hypothetical protein
MTAVENMAAAARPPGSGDARVPCPLCGGLIHPVAGRCKHCKEDLSTLRQGRPQAAAALPALNGHAVAPTITAPAAIAAPVAVATAREGSQPILPQRTTGSHATAQKPSGGLLRSWPMIVIGVAVLAIITAVVIMVLPQDNARNKRLGKPPAPAPERMDSSPIPPKASQLDDPWDQPDKPPSLSPVPDPNPPQQPPDPLAGTQPDPNDPNDLFGGGAGGAAVMFAMAEHACSKMKSCPGVDQTMLSLACDQFKSIPKPQLPQGCPAAKRCMDAIDAMDCSQANSNNPIGAVYLLKDCSSAMTDC